MIQILIGGSTSVFLDESLTGKLFRLIIHPLYRLYIVEALSQTHSDKTLKEGFRKSNDYCQKMGLADHQVFFFKYSEIFLDIKKAHFVVCLGSLMFILLLM